MSNVDLASLVIAMKDAISDDLWSKYDFDSIAQNGELCWDDTAVLCRGNDFEMIIDVLSYEVLDIQTDDASGE